MTRERLKNLRVIDGREMFLRAEMEQYPPMSPKQQEILSRLDEDQKERDAVYSWIESIPDNRTANIFALRFVKNAKWDEIAGYIGGISASGCKQIALRFIKESEKQEDEAKTAAMIEAVNAKTCNSGKDGVK